MHATITETLLIDGEEIQLPTITQRAYGHSHSDDELRQNFGAMILGVMSHQALSEGQRHYIAGLLEDQLTIELQTRDLISGA